MKTHKQTRAELYATWLRDDADGLAHNLPPADPASIQALRTARANLRAALRIVDHAIDRTANAPRSSVDLTSTAGARLNVRRC
jgi:hypothetical protein